MLHVPVPNFDLIGSNSEQLESIKKTETTRSIAWNVFALCDSVTFDLILNK